MCKWIQGALIAVIFSFSVITLLSGCGIKGPLYLPEDVQKRIEAKAQAKAEAERKAEEEAKKKAEAEFAAQNPSYVPNSNSTTTPAETKAK